jgi:hypothetical protein
MSPPSNLPSNALPTPRKTLPTPFQLGVCSNPPYPPEGWNSPLGWNLGVQPECLRQADHAKRCGPCDGNFVTSRHRFVVSRSSECAPQNARYGT